MLVTEEYGSLVDLESGCWAAVLGHSKYTLKEAIKDFKRAGEKLIKRFSPAQYHYSIHCSLFRFITLQIFSGVAGMLNSSG